MEPRFVHLHLHTEYSLIDSTVRIAALVKRCAQLGLPAVAVTDQSNLFALVKFCRAAEKAGVKPIIGADVWVEDAGLRQAARLTLLCQNREGYLTLSQLMSRAYLEGHREGRVVIQANWLQGSCEGLIALAGRDSDIGQRLMENRFDDAAEYLSRWQTCFGDRFYLELVRSGRDGEAEFETAALELAENAHCAVVASNDVRFLDKTDFEAHEARVCIATSRVLADPRRPHDYSAEQYLKTPESMVELFADLPETLENSVEIARRCNLELEFGTYHLPQFPVPAGHDLDSWIAEQARQGLELRLKDHAFAAGLDRAAYDQRLSTELGVICKMGFPGYFLIVADFINWAKQNGIPVGPGRGSGAGSLVAWALRITDLDPLPYDLLFERFLNPDRVSMPDFDIDFCTEGRDRVIDYVTEKYGRDHVSQIITYGTMAAKGVVRDCGRVLGMGYGFVDGISKLIPNVLGIGLEDALGRTEAARTKSELQSPELIARVQDEEEVQGLIELALKLEDLTRNAGKHAGGVVIAPEPLSSFCPLYAEAPAKGELVRGVVTQFDKDDVEAVGLVKFDFLGLRNLTVIDWAVKAINQGRSQRGEPELDISTLPLDDAATYGLFARAGTVAVFQFESSGMQRLLKDARPDRFEDLIALVSLYRPGPMDLIPSFCKRKHGEEAIEYPDPRLEPVLKQTYGVMVYQEQVMQVAQIIGGYSLGNADLLRRAMGKKKAEEMAKHRAVFQQGAAINGLSAQKADEIFDLMEKFASYGFNKSHAAAYALVSYQTAWLKTHYPAEFMAAVLSSDMDSTDKVVAFLHECRALQLAVLPPDVNASRHDFVAIDAKTLRYGLGAIKGVGAGVCHEIAAQRDRDGPYTSFFDFCERLGPKVNRRVHETLIASGALDSLGSNRASMKAQLPDIARVVEQRARDREAGQVDLFGASPAAQAQTLPELASLPELPLMERLKAEREVLGHYLSGHPLDGLREYLADVLACTLDGVEACREQRRMARGDDGNVLLAGQVVAINRRNESRIFFAMEDGCGRVEVTAFSDALDDFESWLSNDALLVVEGYLQEDRFNGGTSLRLRRAWRVDEFIRTQARRITFSLDAKAPETVPRLLATLAPWRGGHASLSIAVHTAQARGIVDGGDTLKLQGKVELIEQLRALPTVSGVRMKLAAPTPLPPRARPGRD